ALRGGKVEVGHEAGNAAVQLFGKGRQQVMAAQARLHMANVDAAIEGAEGCNLNGRGVALDQDPVGRQRLESLVDAVEESAAEGRQGLAMLHYLELEIRREPEVCQRSLQHFPMLAGGHEAAVKLRPR